MYVYVNSDKTILSVFLKDRKQTWRCSGFSSNLNFMTFDFYVAVNNLSVRFTHFLVGLLKHVLLWRLFLSFFAHHLCLEYSSSDDSDESNKEEFDELGYESRSTGTFSTGLSGLLCGEGFPLGVTFHADESCGDDVGSLALP